MSAPLTTPTTPSAKRWIKPAALLLAAVAFAAMYLRCHEEFTLSKLAEREAALRSLLQTHPLLVYGGAFVVYVLATALSLPVASALTLAYGWFFRFWPALILVSFASTTGATLAFLLSRFLFRDAIQARFGDRLAKVNDALAREGPFYLFTLRLIPAAPFFVINVVMGLTPMRVWTFWWVSQVGMLAGTAAYVYAGASVGTLEELSRRGTRGILNPQTILAFTFLGIFPLIVKWIVARMRRHKSDSGVPTNHR
jgi:uncharacterized membrane protein YdjX (TVP38/TMEM64 family)